MTKGFDAERLFVEVMSKRGTVTKSTKDQDMYGHIDFFVDDVSYDVKGEKRMDKQIDDGYDVIWLESINVRGNPGWLYGDATLIAFLIKDAFWIIDRVKLASYTESCVWHEKIHPHKLYKRWYSREGQKDKVTYVYPRDIEHLVIEKIVV